MLKFSTENTENPEQDADEDIEKFELFLEEKGLEPLAKPERAIIKTYLWYKLFGS